MNRLWWLWPLLRPRRLPVIAAVLLAVTGCAGMIQNRVTLSIPVTFKPPTGFERVFRGVLVDKSDPDLWLPKLAPLQGWKMEDQ